MSEMPPKRSVEGRAVIVTGAANGLGLAIAKRFAASGAKVLLVDRDPAVENLPGGGSFPGGSAFALVQDLTEDAAAAVVMRAALNTMGRIDALVNDAAWSFHKPMLDTSVAEFNWLVAVNQRAPYMVAREFFRYISNLPEKPKDPCIVNIASVNALSGNRNLVAYAGTKGALVAMTRAMAVEMAPFRIRVNSISPGAVDTPATQKVFAEGTVDVNTFFDPYLIKRLTSSEEVAELVLYLCSEAASTVTGVNWVIDGGYMAH